MAAEATFEGKEIKRQLCITNVWLKRNDEWQIVARHTASLPGDTLPGTMPLHEPALFRLQRWEQVLILPESSRP